MKCKEKPIIYARVVGFLTPLAQWNIGKQEEFKDRRVYNVPKFGVTIPEHKLKTPEELEADRINIGKEYWPKMGDGVHYEDIDSESRLLNEERESILNKKISDSTIIKLKAEDMEKLKKVLQEKILALFIYMKGGVENWIISFVVSQILAPGKLKEYMIKLRDWGIKVSYKFFDALGEAAKLTETEIDDQAVKDLRDAFGEAIAEEPKKEIIIDESKEV